MGTAGKTILFSSHILEEVERVAQQIEVLVAGRHAASGDFREIRRLMTDRPHLFRVRSSDDRRLAAALIADVSSGAVSADRRRAWRCRPSTSGASPGCCPRSPATRTCGSGEISPADEDLESVFSYLINRSG